MWIKTQDGIIVNANKVRSFMEINGTVMASYGVTGHCVIADYDDSKEAESCLNKLLNALIRDDAVFVAEG